MNTKMHTLFGGKLVTAKLEDGSTVEVRVRQLRLADYEKAFTLLSDEIAFTGFCCSSVPAESAQPAMLDKNWALTLDPESYEVLRATAEEVNRGGFFAYADRRQINEQKNQERLFAAVNKLSPEALSAAAAAGQQLNGSASPNSSPRPRPMPASR